MACPEIRITRRFAPMSEDENRHATPTMTAILTDIAYIADFEHKVKVAPDLRAFRIFVPNSSGNHEIRKDQQ
jgi:hypothetical protein